MQSSAYLRIISWEGEYEYNFLINRIFFQFYGRNDEEAKEKETEGAFLAYFITMYSFIWDKEETASSDEKFPCIKLTFLLMTMINYRQNIKENKALKSNQK